MHRIHGSEFTFNLLTLVPITDTISVLSFHVSELVSDSLSWNDNGQNVTLRASFALIAAHPDVTTPEPILGGQTPVVKPH